MLIQIAIKVNVLVLILISFNNYVKFPLVLERMKHIPLPGNGLFFNRFYTSLLQWTLPSFALAWTKVICRGERLPGNVF